MGTGLLDFWSLSQDHLLYLFLLKQDSTDILEKCVSNVCQAGCLFAEILNKKIKMVFLLEDSVFIAGVFSFLFFYQV